MSKSYDFSGWATKNNLRCSDGRTIRHNAFKDNDGSTVPLVWNHQHNESNNVLGHALLENRDEGVYAYCTFNDTEAGQNAKLLVQHGDITALSIYANQLKQMGGDVIHGAIREVSLVLAGANPGAFIDSIIAHGDNESNEAIIYSGEDILMHSEDEDDDLLNESEDEDEELDDLEDEEIAHAGTDKTVKEVFNSLNEDQKTVVYALVGNILQNKNELNEEDSQMKHNAFENENEYVANDTLSHADMEEIIGDARKYGSLKESFLAHAETNGVAGTDYGIKNLEEVLFPDAKNVSTYPEWIKRDTDWVAKVINGTKHTPFSRIKSMAADITEDAARAKGYIKGTMKKEEVFSLLKRTTTPTTIYKKQKMDRDDVLDITDFDVIAWIKQEMRIMLDEEIARAILIGDGRLSSDDDKISEQNIRPIVNDADLYSIKKTYTHNSAKDFIIAAIKSRKDYKGSGNPILFTTEDLLTDMLLLEDKNERIIYDTEEKLRTALRVSAIVTVPVLEGFTRTDSNGTFDVQGILVNLNDYNVGADKGGSINMFDDFDIDYNQMKYLMETRISGALVKPYSAIVLQTTHTAG